MRAPPYHIPITAMSNRRSSLKASAMTGGAIALNRWDAWSLDKSSARGPALRDDVRSPESLQTLILGGTGFTGPEQLEYAIARGHHVTLFHRNRTQPGMFRGLVTDERIGDLNGDTSALAGKPLDVVIDATIRREGNHKGRRTVHLGAVGIPAGARGVAKAAHDSLVTVVRFYRRLPAPQRCTGYGQGPDLPPARGHGQGHARLAQVAHPRRTGGDTSRRGQWVGSVAWGRGAGDVEGWQGVTNARGAVGG